MKKIRVTRGKVITISIALLLFISSVVVSSILINNDKESSYVSAIKKDNFIVVDSSPDVATCSNEVIQEHPMPELELYEGPVRNIFFHSLIVYPELAFDGGKHQTNYNYWMVTVGEFKKVIEEAYKRGFVLIDEAELYKTIQSDGQSKIVKNDLYLPKGKKPLLLTIDDLNYYKYMEGDGFADKLVLDENGNVATYTKTPDNKTVILRDNDCVPIIDKFVEEHPDFSHNNAKGVVAVTGYEGVFGYRTDLLDSATFKEDARMVKAIANRMKETGWKFASHSYGHINLPKKSIDRLKRDTQKWDREVASLLGKTKLYIYPFGAKVSPTDPKLNYLKKFGFNVFWGVGNKTNFRISNNCVHMERLNIDGMKMHYAPNQMKDLFNVKDVYYNNRPTFKK